MLASQRTTSSFDLTELAATRPAPPPPSHSGSSPSSPERRSTSSLGPARSPPKSPPRCSSRLAMRPSLNRRSRYTNPSRNLEEMIPKAVVDSASGPSSPVTRHKFKLSGDAEAEEETIEDISLDTDTDTDTDVPMKDAFLPFDTIAEDMDEDADSSNSTSDATTPTSNSNTLDSIFIPVPTLASPPHKHSPRRPSSLSPHRGTFYTVPVISSAPAHPIVRPSFTYRHVYPHRGHSRQALFQTRTLWASRRAEWKRWEDEVAEAELASQHGGIIWMPRACPGLSWRSPPKTFDLGFDIAEALSGWKKPALSVSIPSTPPGLPAPQKRSKVTESMFPRAGDLGKLRQANACVSPDWTFRRVPLFRIHTTLFAHELRLACLAVEASVASGSSEASGSNPTTPMLPYLANSSPEMSSSTSTPSEDNEEWDRGGSPDSDVTLVDEERLPTDIGAPPVYSEFDATCLKEGWLARWHVLAELLQSDGRPTPSSPVAVPMFGLSPVEVKMKAKEEETSPSEGKFDALMRMMVEDAIDAGQVDMRGRGSSSSASSSSSSRLKSGSSKRTKTKFYVVPDFDENEDYGLDLSPPDPSDADVELNLSPPDAEDEEESSDDEADDYDYGEPVQKPVFARLSSQLEVRRRAQIAAA